jgi:(1->4)-alpha-D-glucan 1-alpha-D-glucosylmutase
MMRLEAIIPRATYRVQLHGGFRFSDAQALVPYLSALGISHLYCSPFLRARAGSQHGYDVVDHSQLNPEIGTRADFDALVATLHRHGMGLLADLVPNHMGVLGGDNAWWLDVLENGPASAWANYFDIDWHSPDPALAGRVLLPLLGDQYGLVLERGELQLQFSPATGYFTINYYEHRLPIDPSDYAALLRGMATGSLAKSLSSLITRFEALPPRHSTDPAAVARRQRDKSLLKRELAALVSAQPALADAVAQQVAALNGGTARQRLNHWNALDTLISRQAWRLAHWRVAGDEINYRRFFDINELAALRMERAEVFEATHRLVLDLAAQGAIDGMRIDHPDGLADPAAYFRRLQLSHAKDLGIPDAEMAVAPGSPSGAALPHKPLYVVVEKIVAPHEKVPVEWAVHGTTGYRFANLVIGVLVASQAKARLDRAWRVFVGDEAQDFDTLAWRCRREVMGTSLAGELGVLSSALHRLARADRRTRDFTRNTLLAALADVVAYFPVYRTYIVDKPSAQDRRFIDWAIGRARQRSRSADASVFDFLRRVLLGRPLANAPAGLAEQYRAFARRLQQYTSPVAAKGIEDTALYRHHRLIALNDVGSEPDHFGVSVAAFHAASRWRAQQWPHTMLATSTHDAKRSEDVRARVAVISEQPAAWRLAVRRWARKNRSHKQTVAGAPAPSRNDEYLLYQTLVGSFPAGEVDTAALAVYCERIERAMLKSVREAKVNSSWLQPQTDYETALVEFIRALLSPREGNLFLADLRAGMPLFAWYGALNSMSLAALKCVSPGVPDFYQGHAAIELTLMDPDNRSEIDHVRREALLQRAQQGTAADRDWPSLLAHAADGEAKFRLTWAALQLRRQQEALMRDGSYAPLEVRGELADHVLAFARCHGQQVVVAVVARLFVSLGLEVGQAPVGAVWGDAVVELPASLVAGRTLTDALTGQVHTLDAAALTHGLPLARVLRDLPQALMSG